MRLLLVLLCCACTLGQSYLTLTDANFDETLEKSGATVIEFIKKDQTHAAWLDQETERDWAPEFSDTVAWAQVDCNTQKALCEELLTKETAAEKELDVMVYVRTSMAAAMLPRGTEAAAFEAWLRQQLSRPAPGAEGGEEDGLPTNDVEDTHSIQLTAANWDEHTKDKLMLVAFTAVWCGHCQNLKPVWAEAAKQSGDIKFGKVDVDSEEGLSESFGIQGLPTIALIKNGKQYVEYEGQRTVDALLEYLKRPLPSSWKEAGEAPPPQQQEQEEFKWDTLDDPSTVLTQHNWADVTKDKVVMVEAYARWCGACQGSAPAWAEAARREPTLFAKFDVDNEEALSARLNVEYLPTILLVRDGSHFVQYEGERSADALVAFVKADHSAAKWLEIGTVLPPAASPGEFDWNTLNDPDTVVLSDASYKGLITSPMVVDFYAKWCGFCQQAAPELAAASKQHPGLFGKVDVDDNIEMSRTFQVQSLPTIYKVRPSDWKVVVYDGARTTDALVAFALEQHPDSAFQDPPKPDDEDEAPPAEEAESAEVSVLDDSNFDKAIEAATKPLIVAFKAVWCGHCQALTPAFSAAADAHPGRFARVDVDQSEKVSERYKIEGLPTILKIRSDGSYVEHEGGRDQAALEAFATRAESSWKTVSGETVAGGAKQEDEGEEDDDEASLSYLTEEQFDDTYRTGRQAVLAFVSSWCQHCIAFKKTWAALSPTPANVVIEGLVDTDSQAGLVDVFNVTELPTILRVNDDGQVIKYGGMRDAASLEAFRKGDKSSRDKMQGVLAAAEPFSAPAGVEPLTNSPKHLSETISTGRHLLVLLGGLRHQPSNYARSKLIPALAEARAQHADADEGHAQGPLRLHAVSAPVAGFLPLEEANDLPQAVLVGANDSGERRVWRLPHETYEADELWTMAQEGLDEPGTAWSGAAGKQKAAAVSGGDDEDDDEFGEANDGDEAPLPGLEEDEQKKQKQPKSGGGSRGPVTVGEVHVRQLLAKPEATGATSWLILFYDTEDPGYKAQWQRLWKSVSLQLSKEAFRVALYDWRSEPELPELLGLDRGIQAGLVREGRFWVAPEFEGPVAEVESNVLEWARRVGSGAGGKPDVVGVPPAGEIETLTDSDYRSKTERQDGHVWLIMFTKPSCTSCRMLRDNGLKRLASRTATDATLHIAIVDTVQSPRTAKLEGADYHPYVLVRSGGRSFVYTGENLFKPMYQFLTHGWRQLEERQRPQPRVKMLHDDAPEPEDPEAAREAAEAREAARQRDRLASTASWMARNGPALGVLAGVCLVVAAVLLGATRQQAKQASEQEKLRRQRQQQLQQAKKQSTPKKKKKKTIDSSSDDKKNK